MAAIRCREDRVRSSLAPSPPRSTGLAFPHRLAPARPPRPRPGGRPRHVPQVGVSSFPLFASHYNRLSSLTPMSPHPPPSPLLRLPALRCVATTVNSLARFRSSVAPFSLPIPPYVLAGLSAQVRNYLWIRDWVTERGRGGRR